MSYLGSESTNRNFFFFAKIFLLMPPQSSKNRYLLLGRSRYMNSIQCIIDFMSQEK